MQRLSSDALSLFDQREPAISGNGEKLAFIVDRNGKPTLQVRDVRSGKTLPLRHLSKNSLYSSPTLSWNGRYIAVIIQRGKRRLILIEDRLKGRLHYIQTPTILYPNKINLGPHAKKLAVQSLYQDKNRVQLFDLTKILEPDYQINSPMNTQ